MKKFQKMVKIHNQTYLKTKLLKEVIKFVVNELNIQAEHFVLKNIAKSRGVPAHGQDFYEEYAAAGLRGSGGSKNGLRGHNGAAAGLRGSGGSKNGLRGHNGAAAGLRGHNGAATSNKVEIWLNAPLLAKKGEDFLITILCHELTHIMQFENGLEIQSYYEGTYKKQFYKVPPTDNDIANWLIYVNSPWEKEAYEMQEVLSKRYKNGTSR